MGKSGFDDHYPAMKFSLNVLIACPAALWIFIPGGVSCNWIPLACIYRWKSGGASFSSTMYAGLSPLVRHYSCRSLRTWINSLYVLASMWQTSIMLLLYLYNTNRYLLPLFEVNGNFPVRSVAICLFWLTILMNTVLVRQFFLSLGLLWLGGLEFLPCLVHMALGCCNGWG